MLSSGSTSMLKIVVVNIGITFALLAGVDIGAYFLLPADFHFWDYRSKAAGRTEVAGLFYPRYYFEENETRGFDIRPAPRGVTVTNSFYFAIEANELGCRDQKVSFDPVKPLIYAAGDSETWGLVRTNARWTSLLEKKIGVPVLNCGVPGTSQKHQHDKYRHVIQLLKRRPDLVLVTYISNDVQEDTMFPAYIVVDGYLVFNDADANSLKSRVEKGIERLNNPSLVDRIKVLVKRYSLSTQIINALWVHGKGWLTAPAIDTMYDYSDPKALANKEGIEEFARDVCSHGSRFAVLIGPDSGHLTFPDYFSGLHEFLRDRGIFVVDFHKLMSTKGLRYSDLSQFNDPHFSEAGNSRFADALDAQMKEYGDDFGACKNLQGFNDMPGRRIASSGRD
jgi:lysophospholipase L1-like esterase